MGRAKQGGKAMLTDLVERIQKGVAAGWRAALSAARALRGPLTHPFVVLAGGLVLVLFLASRFVVGIEPGEGAVRINRLTGGVSVLPEGWALTCPGLMRVVRYPLREQVFRSAGGARANATPFQSLEGLSIGADVTVRYALDPAKVREIALRLPEDVGRDLVEPVIDTAIYRVLAQHNVREIFSSGRHEIELALEKELKERLTADGVVVRAVFLGKVELPPEYRAGMERLLAEELNAEKMRYTLELKDKQVKEAELTAEAEKVRLEKEAEASGNQEIIAAKARAEAMKHVLPFKEREIEQRRLEAEAGSVTRLKQAEAEAEARRIEAGGEADSRRKLAEAEAYRLEVTGKASSEQMAREGRVVSANPLLIQKTLADKLSERISVIIAPPQAGFVAAGLLGIKDGGPVALPTTPRVAPPPKPPAVDGDAADEEGADEAGAR
jgi:regulator of protease activity HflC (stomatin/prohibitin superfamily)